MVFRIDCMPALYGSTFRNPELYYAVFEAAGRRRAEMPRTILAAGTPVLRAIPRDHEGVTNTADKARTIFGGSASNKNRWTGAQPGGHLEPGRGGLYVSLDVESLVAEARHYSRGNPLARVLPFRRKEISPAPPRSIRQIQGPQTFYVLELRQSLDAADFRPTCLRAFLARLDQDSRVRAELKALGFSSLWSVFGALGEDYSVSRALGNAALSKAKVGALIVPTARESYLNIPGATEPPLNAVIAGPDDVPLAFLHPLGRLAVEPVGGGHLTTMLPL